MASPQDIIDRARVIAKDARKTRYPDAQCLVQVNGLLKAAKRLRPDFWFGSYGTPFVDLALAGALPFPPEYETTFVKGLVFWMDLQEDEYSDDSRAEAMMVMFEKELVVA